MKKTLAILLTILLITTTFSCNMDGTSGIFRKVSQSKAPLSIRYKQLLGTDAAGDYLYFRTLKGVERVNTSLANETVVSSTKGTIIQAAAFHKGDNKLFYITSNEDEGSAKEINVIDALSPPFTKKTPSMKIVIGDTTSIKSGLSIKNLYANSMLLVTGEDISHKKVFELLEYDGTDFSIRVPAAEFIPTNDYDLDAVIQQTGHEQKALGPDSAMLVSFVKSSQAGSGDYEHYLLTKSGSPKKIGSNTIKIANFLYDSSENDNIYVLSTEGKLYYAGTFATPINPWVVLNDSGKSYKKNAFSYAVNDGTSNYHLITKPSLKNSSLVVFSFPYNTITKAGVESTTIQTGYADDLSLVNIVSAQVKTNVSPTKLLVATDENGMYDITIINANANDGTGNGSSSDAEDYTF